MHAYIKKGTGKITINYRELAQKMYFNDENIEISHYGNNETLWGEDPVMMISLDKWVYDKRWIEIDASASVLRPHSCISGSSRTNKILAWTDNVEVTTMDQRAYYRMVYIITTELAGLISEDEQSSWMTPQEFYDVHKTVIEMDYAEANDISLKEISTIELNEEPGNY
ncbi:hypothetical protein DT351_11105 (plasmid) [Latilactobacillus curvatus]|uniref:Uncharacterized protein n=1 Tax=Latilactobacillus curvatus TaxID=28038 RepID=A0A385AGY1_LATCU|nr:hypothetical protein [Latilactobacillus curvatus]AXN36888.1 hypothetical protein DT351_11105 [Latilactobacillus curvatus]